MSNMPEIEYISHQAWIAAAHASQDADNERCRPFYLLRPRVYPDGNQWCALYGENLQDGVAGFGDTPAQASVQFDTEWLNAKVGNLREVTRT
jgi:hypothetical protein